jgi:hypothetical protein
MSEAGFASADPKFTLVWLLDDFSGSGNTYIRFDSAANKYKGKLPKIYDSLHRSRLVDPAHYEVFLVLYVATRQSLDHIEYWTGRFTAEFGYKPLRLSALCTLEREVSLSHDSPTWLADLTQRYYDDRSFDKHMRVGGTEDARLGFAGCALPLVLAHNTPNNSIYLLWGPEGSDFVGLFPRVSRHREF